MQSYWSALQFAPTNLPVFYRGMPQASHGNSITCNEGMVLWYLLGPRQRNPSEKGIEERINWLKEQRI